ncbi:MAG: HAD-IIB family hydrolase [Candidatus Thermoplasmatota archaeon]
MICIFTDLDGCLLDEEYRWQPAKKGLNEIKKRDIDLCIVTSKTFEEVVPLWKELELDSPFAYENGGGIAAPPGLLDEIDEDKGGFELSYLGKDYDKLRKVFEQVKEKVQGLKGFGDMTVREISETSGLDLDSAKRAKKRRHEEVFLPDDEAASLFEERGYRVVKGTRYYHLMGDVDKGAAVQRLKEILKPEISFSIGDSENDYPMFKVTDKGALLGGKKPIETDYGIDWKKVEIREGKGPRVWDEVVRDFLEDPAL